MYICTRFIVFWRHKAMARHDPHYHKKGYEHYHKKWYEHYHKKWYENHDGLYGTS